MTEGPPKQIEDKNAGWFLKEVVEKPFRIVSAIGVIVGLIGLGTNYLEQHPKFQEQEINSSKVHTATPEEIKYLAVMAFGTLLFVASEQKNGRESKR